MTDLAPDPAPDPDLVAEAVLAVVGVAGLHGGAFGQVATHLPGRSVTGVRLTPERTEVHLVVDEGVDIPTVAESVRRAVRVVAPAPVDVFVEDVAPPAFDVAAAVDDQAAHDGLAAQDRGDA